MLHNELKANGTTKKSTTDRVPGWLEWETMTGADQPGEGVLLPLPLSTKNTHLKQNPLIRDRQICPYFTKAQLQAPPDIKQALKAQNACRKNGT